MHVFFFFQAEDGIRDSSVTGVQTCALPISQSYWSKGLATEAASAWVRAAFDDFHIDRLTSFVHPGNVGSIRVLEKLGFRAAGRGTVIRINSILFSLGAHDVCAVPVPLPNPDRH